MPFSKEVRSVVSESHCGEDSDESRASLKAFSKEVRSVYSVHKVAYGGGVAGPTVDDGVVARHRTDVRNPWPQVDIIPARPVIVSIKSIIF